MQVPLRLSSNINDPSELARFLHGQGGPIGLPLRTSNDHRFIVGVP